MIIRARLLLLIFLLLPGIAAYFFLSTILTAPGERKLAAENNDLKNQYRLLKDQVGNLSVQLDSLGKKDDQIYRSILGMDPLDPDIRKAGTGGFTAREMKYPEIISQTADKIENLRSKLAIEENSLIKIREFTVKNRKRMLHLPAIMPVSNKDLSYTGSGFGMRFHPILRISRMHEGLDFIAPAGSEVYATADGVVTAARVSSTFGNIIEIDHGFGYKTLYAHLKAFNVEAGESVKRGQVVAWVGNTGLSAGTHLHYEVHFQGKEIDPVHYFFNDLSPGEYEQIIKLASENKMSLD